MPLNYRAMPETDCTQLPKVCIISLYKRISKACLSILNKGVCVAGMGGDEGRGESKTKPSVRESKAPYHKL